MIGNWWKWFLTAVIIGCVVNHYLTSPKEEETTSPSVAIKEGSSSLSEVEISQTAEEKEKQESSSIPEVETAEGNRLTEVTEEEKQKCKQLIADRAIGWDSRKDEPSKKFLEFIENEFVPEQYDGSNACKYLDFYYALMGDNLTSMKEFAPATLDPAYRDRYYNSYIRKRNLAIHQWFHSRYGLPRNPRRFIYRALDARNDFRVTQWLQSTLNFTKQEVLSEEGSLLDFMLVSFVPPVAMNLWLFEILNITLADILTVLDRSYSRSLSRPYSLMETELSFLEALADRYHVNFTESPYTEEWQKVSIQYNNLHKQGVENFLNYRFKPFNCSKECCTRIMEMVPGVYHGDTEETRTRTKNCQHLRFHEAVTNLNYDLSSRILATAPATLDESDKQYYSLELYKHHDLSYLDWFLEKYEYRMERSVSRFIESWSWCQKRKQILAWEMATFNYTHEELLKDAEFVYCYSTKPEIRELLEPFLVIPEAQYAPFVKKPEDLHWTIRYASCGSSCS